MYDRRIIRGNTYALNQLPAVSCLNIFIVYMCVYCIDLKARSCGIQEAARGAEKTTSKEESKRENEGELSKASRRKKAH